MIDIEFDYRKPHRCIDLVCRELGEVPTQQDITIARIQVLEAKGKIRKLHTWSDYWCRCEWGDDEEDDGNN